jgi:hypothetical protein
MNKTLRLAAPFLAASIVLSGAAFVGCSSDDSGGNEDPTKTDTGARDTEVPTTDTGAPVDSGATDTGAPSDGGSDAPWSLESGVCFPGKPTKMVEYLNKCTTADSVKFTKKLTKLNADGSRPALP